MKNNINKKERIKKYIRWGLTIVTIIISILAILSINKLDILPVKYFLLLIAIECVINILILFLLQRKKIIWFIIGVILMIIINIGNIILSNYTQKTNRFIEKTFAEYTTTTTDYILVTSSNNSITALDEIDKNQNIYYFKYSRNVNSALKKLGDYKYTPADNFANILTAIDKDSNNYLLISKGDYDYAMSSTILYNKDNYKVLKEFKVKHKEKINNEIKDSYTIYLNGTDFTGIMRDYNVLITINTKTKKILMTTILRGYYIDVPAYGMKDTLMCLGGYDSNVSKEAIEKLLDIKIDYIVNVNTNSLVDIVDTLGGVEFCSDYSFRTTHILTDNTYNDKNGTKLNVVKGCKEYNGLEALAIARERLNLKNNERGRIENCQKILMSIIKKSMTTQALMNFDEVLNSYSNLYTTNMNRKVITNLAKSFIDNYGEYEINTINLDGTDGTAIGHLGTQEVGVTFPNYEQVKEASSKIKKITE